MKSKSRIVDRALNVQYWSRDRRRFFVNSRYDGTKYCIVYVNKCIFYLYLYKKFINFKDPVNSSKWLLAFLFRCFLWNFSSVFFQYFIKSINGQKNNKVKLFLNIFLSKTRFISNKWGRVAFTRAPSLINPSITINIERVTRAIL